MSYNIKYNPEWRKDTNHCCAFCGETRSVKYLVDLNNCYGDRVLTVEACNSCVFKLSLNDKRGSE